MSPKFMAFVLSDVEGIDHKTACGHGDKGGENDSRRYVKGGYCTVFKAHCRNGGGDKLNGSRVKHHKHRNALLSCRGRKLLHGFHCGYA